MPTSFDVLASVLFKCEIIYLIISQAVASTAIIYSSNL